MGAFLRWASGLRFPYIFMLVAVLFVFNLFIPDVVPFVDEILMGLVAALLASLRKKPKEQNIDHKRSLKQKTASTTSCEH